MFNKTVSKQEIEEEEEGGEPEAQIPENANNNLESG